MACSMDSEKGHACNTTICAILPSIDLKSTRFPLNNGLPERDTMENKNYPRNYGIHKTFENLCEFYETLHDLTKIKTIHLGLGDCNTLLDPDSK